MTFASLTNAGNSPGDDLGVRLSGPACVVVLLIACLAFSFYDEHTVMRELASGVTASAPERAHGTDSPKVHPDSGMETSPDAARALANDLSSCAHSSTGDSVFC